MTYVKTDVPGVYVRHEKGCKTPAAYTPRCRTCAPSWRGKTRSHGWSRTFRTKAEAVGWKADVARGLVPVPDRDAQPVEALTFRAIVEQWWQAVENSEVGTRKRRRAYSPNTLRQYRTALDVHVLPEMGDRLAEELTLMDWQRFVDGLRRKGLKTNSINCYINPARAVYAYACSPRRMLLPVNALAGVELPPVDEEKRERVAAPAEAARLIAALEPDDQVVWALAFYTGCRSMEIGGDRAKGTTGVDWQYVDFEQGGLFVPDSKSEAGVRWVPMVKPLRAILRAAWLRQGKPSAGRVVVGSVRSAKERALGQASKGITGTWEKAGLDPIGLHECRHTFVSYLSAAGVPLKVQAEIAGHEEETITIKRYTHVMPGAAKQAGAMLDAYLEGAG
jgi:integrase